MIARPIAALPSPVREVRGLAFEEVLEPEQRCDLLYAADDFALWRPSNAEPEPQVLPHAHVRIERVVLKDHRDVAVRQFEVRHVHVADRDRAFRDLLEAGDHPPERRLPATRRTDEHHELPVGDCQRDVVSSDDAAGERLRHVVELDGSHAYGPVSIDGRKLSSRPASCP